MIKLFTGFVFLAMTLTFNSAHAVEASSFTSKEQKALVNILNLNDKLFNELLKEDQKAVESSALKLKEAISSSSGLIGELKKNFINLNSIKKNNSKEDNLKAYGEFLPSLVVLVNKYKPDSNYEVYYCPMVKKNWIQDQRTNSTVKNVFAQEMLECGEKS